MLCALVEKTDLDYALLQPQGLELIKRNTGRMERNEGIVRWSPNVSRDEFMVLNLNHRIIQLYGAKGNAQPGSFDYQRLSKHNDFPPLNTYDWSPAIRGLVALGISHGEVNLLRVDDDSNDHFTLPLTLKRSCQSVAFNTTGLLALGLDRRKSVV